MPSPRFLLPNLVGLAGGGGERVALPAGEAHHARRVLRLADGARVELLDGNGRSATGVLVDGSSVELESIVEHAPVSVEVTVFAALPKGPRADQMVDQLTQLGVRRLVPLVTEHGMAVPKPGRLDKLRRVVESAMKQSGNPWAMVIEPAVGFAESLELAQTGAAWLADCVEAADYEASSAEGAVHTVWVGPEGGWSERERAAAEEAGLRRLSLGRYTLRVETAAVAAATCWLSRTR